MRLKIFICALLAGITLAIYWPARHFNIINYDDPYFVASPQVNAGLNWHSFEWAMTGVVASNWHPMTNLSFLLMRHFFGFNPGAEHLLNVIFHAANAALVFLVLVQMTGATWRSALVAGIFAWHPLRLESVAWIAERKDVLYVFFMLLALLCYAEYARAGAKKAPPQAGTPTAFHLWNTYYISALFLFILSFMSKATVVTLPFLLILVDIWPLQRLNRSSVRGLLIEKIPFFALTVIFSALTFWIHKTQADVGSLEKFGIRERIENAVLSYVNYLGHFFWPSKLAVFYPYPNGFDGIEVMVAALLLLAISALCILQLSCRPYLAVGWFWYLGSMVPVIGLVQIGEQAMADRHTYIPLIGMTLGLVWLVSDWAGNHLFRRWLTVFVAGGALTVCLVSTREQMPFWQNSVTLFERTIAVTPADAFPQFSLARGLEAQGLLSQAAVHYRIAAEMKPEDYRANLDFSAMLLRQGYYHEAEERLEVVLRRDPDLPLALNNFAWMLATCPDASVRDGKRAVQLAERACGLTHYRQTAFVSTLAAAYAEAGRFEEAAAMAQKAVALAEQRGETGFIQENQDLLQLYLAHEAYHEPGR